MVTNLRAAAPGDQQSQATPMRDRFRNLNREIRETLAVWIGLAILVHAWRGYRAVRRSAAVRRKSTAVGS